MADPRQRRFCVVTTGRTGSTSLMDAIASHADVAVPARQVVSPDHELLLPAQARQFASHYAHATKRAIDGPNALIDAFFEINAAARWAGFKTMPNRHHDARAFFSRPDIRFVVLLRDDVVATAASFLLARLRGTWRRHGGTPEDRITFAPEHHRVLLDNLAYLHAATRFLLTTPRAIHLRYEALCAPDFASTELDEFFERPVRIANPRPPTRAQSYVSNAEDLTAFVTRAWQALESGRPSG